MAPLQRRVGPRNLGTGESCIAGPVETEGLAHGGARFIAPSAWVRRVDTNDEPLRVTADVDALPLLTLARELAG